ncbi:MAG: hypothetical protein OXQ89_23405 [Rhodospirillaceae bacterium]|nr:hypothetical protein [Rhodospirillaceae bacterium]
MQEAAETGYRGFALVESGQSGSYHLVSPTGVKVALFSFSIGRSMPSIHSLVKDLDCGEGHPTPEHAIRYIVNHYEQMTTTAWVRVRRSVSKFVSHGGWGAVAAVAAIIGAIAAIVAATAAILTYLHTIGSSVVA